MTNDSVTKLSPLQRAYLALERLQAKVDAMEQARTEPIAILGMSCRMPSTASTPEEFWRSLRDGVCQTQEVPRARWDNNKYWDPDPKAPGKIYSRFGNFLDDVPGFDCDFFGISPREAISMDPQHRLLLETSWEALETVGIAPPDLYSSPTGVFIGISSFDYTLRLASRGLDQVDAYVGSGNCHSAAAGRLSYFFGFQGPSIAIDTACSSSLVAIHLACESLRNGECKMALAGGVNAILDPALSINFAKARMLSEDGLCKTFDAAADGYVRGEGAGIVVLKRLSQAVADGDPIAAVIRGSAVNQDGPSAGLTVPNGPAQEAVIRRALQTGRVDPSEVSYIEAHGTGTQLGDPIELGALNNVFGPNRKHPLYVGSVKTNIGHLEAAAGVAGLLKVVLMLQHRAIPPHLHLKSPNAKVPWNEMPFKIPVELMDWNTPSATRIAGLSSFGFNGTNAHLVLEEFSAATRTDDSPVTPQVLALSANSVEALGDLCKRQSRAVGLETESRLPDAAYTLGVGRSHFPYRVAIVASSINEAVERLQSAAQGGPAPFTFRNSSQRATPPRLAFVFPGEGAPYVGMGRTLYENQPAFRDALDSCDAILKPQLQSSLISTLYGADEKGSLLQDPQYSGPVLFCVEYALARMWTAWGVIPSCVLGEGIGEYAAACIAGVFDLESALKLVVARGRAMSSEARVEFSNVAKGIRYSPARIDIVPSIETASDRIESSEYWEKQLTLPTRISASLDDLSGQGNHLFLRMGASADQAPVPEEAVQDAHSKWLASLRDGNADWEAIREAQAQLYVSGIQLNWKQIYRGGTHRKLSLPTYPFQHRDFWVDLPESAALPQPERPLEHPLLQPRHSDDDSVLLFELPLSRTGLDYLQDHRIGRMSCLPASAYIELALFAAKRIVGDTPESVIEVHDLDLTKVLPLREDQTITVKVGPGPFGGSDHEFELSVQMNGRNGSSIPSAVHATAKLRSVLLNGNTATSLANRQPVTGTEVDPAALYQNFEAKGLAYGPSFRAIQRVIAAEDEVYVEARLPDALSREPYHIHPVLLDACMQGLGALTHGSADSQGYVPVGVGCVRWFAEPGEDVRCVARLKSAPDPSSQEVTADVDVYGKDGRSVATLSGIRLQQFTRAPAPARNGHSENHSAASAKQTPSIVPGGSDFVAVRDLPPDEQREQLIAGMERILVRVLRSDASKSIDRHVNFFEKGVDSLMSVEFVDTINEQLGLRLPPETLLMRPTLADLAKEVMLYLDADGQMSEGSVMARPGLAITPWIAHYSPKPDPDIRLFCFHHLGGTAALFSQWAAGVPENIDVCPVQLPGRGERAGEPAITSFDELQEILSHELLDYLDRPFAFLGHSGGNLVAFELAHLIKRRFGLQPAHFFVGSLWAPQSVETRIGDFGQADLDAIARAAGQQGVLSQGESTVATTTLTESLIQSDLKLFSTYEYAPTAPLDCGITAFIGRDDELVKKEDLFEWSCHTNGSFRVELVPGTHSSYLSNRDQVLKVIISDLMKVGG